ncbi:MAG: hypothetical protein R3357_13895, partial [Burkholderiales bacterium]|nr:hypothetical protein [Burkholderiales bacterium]
PDAARRAGVSIALGSAVALVLLPRAATRGAALALALCAQALAAGVVESVYHALRLTISPASFTWLQQRVVHWMYEHEIATGILDALYVPLLHDFVAPQARIWGWTIALFAIGFALVFLGWARALLAGAQAPRAARLARAGFAAYAVSAAGYAVMFATAGRYMDIPWSHAVLPLAAGLTLVALAKLQPGVAPERCAVTTPGSRFGRHAPWLLGLAALVCLAGEAAAMLGGADFVARHPALQAQVPLIAASIFANHELLLWCAFNLALGFAFRLSYKAARRAPAVA